MARSEGVAIGVFALLSHLHVSGVERGKNIAGLPDEHQHEEFLKQLTFACKDGNEKEGVTVILRMRKEENRR